MWEAIRALLGQLGGVACLQRGRAGGGKQKRVVRFAVHDLSCLAPPKVQLPGSETAQEEMIEHLVPLAHVDDMLNLTGLQSPPDLVGRDLLDRLLDFFEKLARCESHSTFSRSGFVFWDE